MRTYVIKTKEGYLGRKNELDSPLNEARLFTLAATAKMRAQVDEQVLAAEIRLLEKK